MNTYASPGRFTHNSNARCPILSRAANIHAVVLDHRFGFHCSVLDDGLLECPLLSLKTIEPHRRFSYDGAMNQEDSVPQSQALKQARLDRLNNDKLNTPRPTPPSKPLILAQQKIDRVCSTRFANAVAAGRILKTEDEVLYFAQLPRELMGKADLAGIHDMASLEEFLANQGGI